MRKKVKSWFLILDRSFGIIAYGDSEEDTRKIFYSLSQSLLPHEIQKMRVIEVVERKRAKK